MLSERGDTLIEVTFALAILGFVLLGSMAIATSAFRLGQTASERTQVAAAAQEQLEALRSFRDNHTWDEFRQGANCGTATGYCGIDKVLTIPCTLHPAQRCFHMVIDSSLADGSTQWVPVAGPTNTVVPTSVLEIEAATTATSQCAYNFVESYSFEPLGGGAPAANQITTRLANLKYDGAIGACP